MPDSRGRSCATLQAFALLIFLGAASCQFGDSALDEANRLNQSAGEDVREIEKIVQENKGKEREVTRALNAGNTEAARKLMDESVQAIDRGLERGQSAADKLARASTLNVDPTIKEYLSLRAQSVNKAVEAFRELRRGVISFRDATGSKDKAATEKARDEIRQTSERFDQLITESNRLGSQADEVARRNPEKIKPGS
jgi:Mg2+ and Co2+ transporter CorA